MNTEEEAKQAQHDYIKGINGFEGAREWNSFVVREDDFEEIKDQSLERFTNFPSVL